MLLLRLLALFITHQGYSWTDRASRTTLLRACPSSASIFYLLKILIRIDQQNYLGIPLKPVFPGVAFYTALSCNIYPVHLIPPCFITVTMSSSSCNWYSSTNLPNSINLNSSIGISLNIPPPPHNFCSLVFVIIHVSKT